MASQSKKRKQQCPQVHINVICLNSSLKSNIIAHLKLLMNANGNTVTVMPDVIPISSDSSDFKTALIKSKNTRRSIEQLTEVWDELRKQHEEEVCTDFVIFHQSIESLQALSSIIGSRSRDEKSQYLVRRMYRRENETRIVEMSKDHIFRIQLYIFDGEGKNDDKEEDTLNAVINFACKTLSRNRIFHYQNRDRPGDIWSRIYGLIQAEAKFSPILYEWLFCPATCEKTRKDALEKKRKQFFLHAKAVANYVESGNVSEPSTSAMVEQRNRYTPLAEISDNLD